MLVGKSEVQYLDVFTHSTVLYCTVRIGGAFIKSEEFLNGTVGSQNVYFFVSVSKIL